MIHPKRLPSLVVALGCAGAIVRRSGHKRQHRESMRTRLRPIVDAKPLLGDYPEFIEPVREVARFEAPLLVADQGADLHVRAWRYSYNARGIIEMPNRFRAADTALIMVHPWAIDDGQGWKTPEPNGVCDFCTPTKNHLAARHTREVINPFLKSLRGKVAFVMYSLPGPGDSIRKKVYRTFGHSPSVEERTQGKHELKEKLASLSYKGEALPAKLTLSSRQAGRRLLPPVPRPRRRVRSITVPGFWDVPIPVTKDIDTDPADVVIFDAEGYPALRDFLKKNKVRHVLLTGYATDMCYCRTTAGYLNLSKDFNVFLVGDASLATFPSNSSPRFATNASLSFAAIDQLITQISWVHYTGTNTAAR